MRFQGDFITGIAREERGRINELATVVLSGIMGGYRERELAMDSQ
jgi:hypothetical protein